MSVTSKVIRSRSQMTTMARNVNGNGLTDTSVSGAVRTLTHLSMFLRFGIIWLYFENNGTMIAKLVLTIKFHLHSIALQFDCFVKHNMF